LIRVLKSRLSSDLLSCQERKNKYYLHGCKLFEFRFRCEMTFKIRLEVRLRCMWGGETKIEVLKNYGQESRLEMGSFCFAIYVVFQYDGNWNNITWRTTKVQT
jgi:hypothetical protein